MTITAGSERAFTDARREQGFTSQRGLDAFYAYFDHTRECTECGRPAPAHWNEADASWQPCQTVCPEGRRLSDVESAIRDSERAAIVEAPHVMVTWANAITTGQRVTECFPSRELAHAAMADRSRERWNNTRVSVAWHEAHALKFERAAMYDAHRGDTHVWGLICKACKAMSDHRDESVALVIAARDAAGDHDLAAVTS